MMHQVLYNISPSPLNMNWFGNMLARALRCIMLHCWLAFCENLFYKLAVYVASTSVTTQRNARIDTSSYATSASTGNAACDTTQRPASYCELCFMMLLSS